MRADASPAVQLGTGSAPGLVQCGLGLTCTAGVASGAIVATANTATTDAITGAMAAQVRTESNSAAIAGTIAQAGTTGFAAGQYWTVKNIGVGVFTLTPTTSTIDGQASCRVPGGRSIDFYSDGTNYILVGGACIPGGTAIIATAAITANSCATVVTASAPGVTTSDIIAAEPNIDISSLAGYGSGGTLYVQPYPTANTANFKVCNGGSTTQTPGLALTLNWGVIRP